MKLKRIFKIIPRCFGDESILRVRGYILMFSHMRGYTSLYSHIVGSHPSIAGYAEMHRKLRNRMELLDMLVKIEESSGKGVAGKYAFDKLLHNELIVSKGVLRRPDVRCLVVVREPKKTIESILGNRMQGYETLDDAITYYVGRISYLKKLVEWCGGNCALIFAESIINDTQKTLVEMSTYLNLTPVLSENYEIFEHTGKRGFGDSSENIFAGKVIDESDRKKKVAVEVSDGEISQVYDVYNDFIDDASRRCEKVIQIARPEARG